MPDTTILNPPAALASASTVLHPQGPIASVGFTRIRDRILIDATLRDRLRDQPSSVILVARQIEHAPGIDLVLPGHHVLIVADHYDAKGQTIDVSGASAAPGHNGSHGPAGFAAANTSIPGGPGTRGASAGTGANAGSIRIIAQQLGDVHLVANGGSGGKGGDGGTGGRGGDGRLSAHFDGFPGSPGGPGGAAGNGGGGGRGGEIDVEFTAAGVPPPLVMEVDGGSAGAAGRRGPGGDSGALADAAAHGAAGAAGHAGVAGAAGTIRIEPISAASFWTHAISRLHATTAAAWAAYRLLVGVYLYRQYKPTVAVRDNNLRLASTEFEAVLHLQPGQSDALRYGKQIELGQNFLGLAANLDLDPRFDEYLTRYASFATFISVFYSQGINLLIAGEAERIAELQKSLDIGRISTETNYATADRDAALSGVDAADETVKDVDGRLTQINARIKEALAKVPDSSISIGTVLTTVGIVAAAVGSVIAAVPTAGASLYALVPSLSGLAVQFSQIGGRLFEATDVEKTALKDKYEKVGKNFEAVGKGVTSVVNLVQAMQKLTDGRTPGNAEVVDLMRQGVQLAHELLVAKLRKEQADLTVIARQIQVGGSTEAAKLATAQLAQLVNGERIFVAAGRSAIRATQRKIDTILEVSFRAQRSIEIYTFRDRPGIISFDTGFIHPDIEASFDDGELAISDLVRKYSESFLPLLDPLDLQNDFDHYFTSDAKFELVPGVYLASIRDASILATFRTSQTGTRSASLLVDVPELPANQLEMKIERVSVALVGASSTGPALNCTVQHGGIYLLRGRDASAVTQQLSPHITQANPQFVSFQSSRPPPSTGAQGEARARTDHLWGRGVGGQWLVTVDDKDLQANGVDLTGLTEIQLWIETQAFVAVTTHK